MSRPFNNTQPSSVEEKTNVARGAMGMPDNKSGGSPKFHSIQVSHAENGYIVDHVSKSNPTGPDKTTKTLVTPDHPAHKHIRAIHEHCGG